MSPGDPLTHVSMDVSAGCAIKNTRCQIQNLRRSGASGAIPIANLARVLSFWLLYSTVFNMLCSSWSYLRIFIAVSPDLHVRWQVFVVYVLLCVCVYLLFVCDFCRYACVCMMIDRVSSMETSAWYDRPWWWQWTRSDSLGWYLYDWEGPTQFPCYHAGALFLFHTRTGYHTHV